MTECELVQLEACPDRGPGEVRDAFAASGLPQMLRVTLQRTKGEEAIDCRAAFRKQGGVANPKAALVQSICESVKIL